MCESHGRWIPRTWPLRAHYNDYGSIEDVEEGAARDVVLECLQKDAIEKGVGDNSVHDVAVRPDMDFDAFLDAIWEGRVQVIKKKVHTPESTKIELSWEDQHPLPGYTPTLRRVGDTLLALATEKQNYLVDEVDNHIRVRWKGHGDLYGKNEEHLNVAKELLSQTWAAVLVAGSGNYADSCELRVFTAPGKDDNDRDRHVYRPDTEAPLLLQQGMIREDVWKALCKHTVEGEYNSTTNKYRRVNVNAYRKGVKDYFEEMSIPSTSEGIEKFLSDMQKLRERENDPHLGAHLLDRDIIGTRGAGLATHAKLLIERGIPEGFSDTVAEFTFIWHVLANTRYVWRPSDTAGPQFGDWEQHAKLHVTYAKVAQLALKKCNREE